MKIISFPVNEQAFARRRWLAAEIEATRDDLDDFGIHPAQIRSLEELGRVLTWLDAKVHAQTIVERREEPAAIVREALTVNGRPGSNGNDWRPAAKRRRWPGSLIASTDA